MHKEDYRALEKMAGEFHSRQLNDTHLFENLLLEKANKNIPCFYDIKPHILFLSIWDQLYVVSIFFQLEFWVLQKLVFDWKTERKQAAEIIT